MNPDIRFLSCPLIETQNECIVVLGFLYGCDHDVVGVSLKERMFGRKLTLMFADWHWQQFVVKFVASADGGGITPIATVRIEGVGEFVMPLVDAIRSRAAGIVIRGDPGL